MRSKEKGMGIGPFLHCNKRIAKNIAIISAYFQSKMKVDFD